jgi:glycosyltransferase involved in cell wall biosynthesis
MNILINSLCGQTVPPLIYGGAERGNAFLVKGLQEIGYDPVLLCKEGSSIDCKKLTFSDYPGTAAELLGQAEAQYGHFDIIHESNGSNVLFDALSRTHPVVRTLHVVHSADLVIGLSRAAVCDGLPYTHTGVDLSLYDPCYTKDDYVVFLGQARRNAKHLHYCTAVAKHYGLRMIVIAPEANSEMDYLWENFNAYPFAWINGADDATKSLYIRKAKCVIHCSDTTWKDAAPTAVLESLALGTPVIGNYSGGIPEMIVDGVTGFLVNSEIEAIRAYARIDEIQPENCRAYMEKYRTHVLFAKRTAVIYEELQNLPYLERCERMGTLQARIDAVE